MEGGGEGQEDAEEPDPQDGAANKHLRGLGLQGAHDCPPINDNYYMMYFYIGETKMPIAICYFYDCFP